MKEKVIENPVEFAVEQILGIEKEIEDQFEKIPNRSKYTIKYEDFCEDPEKHLRELRDKFTNQAEIEFHLSESLKNIKRSEREKVNSEESAEIEKIFEDKASQ